MAVFFANLRTKLEEIFLTRLPLLFRYISGVREDSLGCRSALRRLKDDRRSGLLKLSHSLLSFILAWILVVFNLVVGLIKDEMSPW